MDQRNQPNEHLQSHLTMRTAEFIAILTRLENLEAENVSLEARLANLEASHDQQTPDDGEVKFVSARPATPHECASKADNRQQQIKNSDGPGMVDAGKHLKFIHTLDFISDKVKLLPTWALYNKEIPLFVDIDLDEKHQATATYTYVVTVGENIAHLGTGFRLATWIYGRKNDWRWFSTITEKNAFEGSVLKMKAQPKEVGGSAYYRHTSLNRSKSQRLDQQVLPEYMYEVGEVLMKSQYHGCGPEPARSTDCHLVIDVCSNERTLWLVYRYKGVEAGGRMVSRKKKFNRDDDMFQFVKGDQGFDVCQVAEGLRDWLMEDGTFKHVHNAQALIKSTRCRADPEFSAPLFEDFLAKLKQQH
ncbi:hypothetical protein BKA67DRAFT_656323 [Truncatella angustata]|uniref:Uncharacterized protein n=1 Tax=Truncatella angustata TaxID=152316 RepID=A0A9P9A093_9PEZI|nr:uncharacterized protein BKA67DRAFT_656323 [Truncatella angustata]KAH6658097.1 hypothetical protein BKA67DRAFT_656323 [Truncatella angustata]